ncbi:unnamed protein product [Eruca vesicaria subsp. sativa]|uniref:Cytochrome P450 n=1 Tax=Eruca vesicaria subsp. sativa TaxID=29727 RepID=A0ABC8JKF5_ERUVS|nr:unnamed protein product [Eruca vesicaria subsp. sativa]
MVAMFIADFQNSSILILLCLFSFICYSFFFLKKRNNSVQGCNLPPSPPSLPIIGHLHLLLSPLIHRSLQKLSSKYGPLLYLRVFNAPMILVSSASIAYEIFKTQDVNVSLRNFPASEGSLFFGSSGFAIAPYGGYWKFIKKLMTTKLIGPQALERSRGIRADEVNRFYLNLVDKATKKESVVIAEEAMKLVLNITCKMLMGKRFSEDEEKVRGLVSETDVLSKKLVLAVILREPLAKFGISLFKKDLASISRRYDEVLEKSLLECSDTSTNAIQWTMAEIFNNSKILERLREEIDSVIEKTRLIQETDLPNLPYLEAAVKEALRLHPPAPVVLRTFQEGCKFRGFDVLEKTTLLVNGYAVMRDPNIWEYPEEFKPERFLLPCSRSFQEDEIKEEILKYLPFGSGRRGCPGSNLAYLSVGTAVGVMVQCFDWKIEGDKVSMEEVPRAMTLTMAHPLKCIPLLRNPNPLPSNALERSRGICADEVNRFYLNLVDKATKKESVVIAEEAMKLIINSMCKMLMGKRFSEDEEKVRGLLVSENRCLVKEVSLGGHLARAACQVWDLAFQKGFSQYFSQVR